MGDSKPPATASPDTTRLKLAWAAVTVLGVVAGYAAVLLASHRHFFTDDTESQYVPLWLEIGRHLRSGTLPGLAPDKWMAGNLVAEGQGSLFNPGQLLVGFISPSFDNMVVLSTGVKLAYTIILAIGIYRICLEYGGRAHWAAVAGVAFPFSGWMLFFDQASWVLGLAGSAWLVNAWASGVRYARGRSGPLPVFAFLYLAVTMGEVWPTLETALMVVAVLVGEIVHQRAWQPSLRLMLAAGCAGLVGLMTYLPGYFSGAVTWREAKFGIKNDGFLTVPWEESLNASLPSTLPSFNSWFGPIQPFPVVYIAWFLIPCLAFVDWRGAAKSARNVSAVGIFAGVALFWTAGPAAIGPVRWPARALPMLALSLLILVCVLLSRHGTLQRWRLRAAIAGGLILVLLARSISSAPYGRIPTHIVAAVVVAALGAAVLVVATKRGAAAACAALLVTVPPIAFYQVHDSLPHPMSWNFPESRSEMQAVFPDFDGVTLQLGDARKFPYAFKNADGVYTGLVVGNFAEYLDLAYVNGYTPLGHLEFERNLCMTWDGSVCGIAYDLAFRVEPSTGKSIVDLLKVDRVTLQRSLYPDVRESPPPPGWQWVDQPLPSGKWIWVLEREGGPVSSVNGRISATQGVDAASESETDFTSRARVTSENGGRVVFARLNWPGYRVTLDGDELEPTSVLDTFLAVDIPAGTHDADLVVTYRPPGWRLGAVFAVLGLAGIGALQWLYVRRRREDDAAPADEHVDESGETDESATAPG